MSFVEDLISEMNQVKIYDVVDDGKIIKTISCETVCDIITVLMAKYGLEAQDDLHG